MAPRKRKQPAAAETAAATGRKGATKRSAAAVKDTAAAKRRRIEKKEVAIPLESGHCFTFGTNPFGALGHGEDVTEKPRAALVGLSLDDEKARGSGPAQIVQVAAGGMHTAALDRSGTVFTWGVNDEGALGRPTGGSAWEDAEEADKEDSTVPGLARMPSGERVVQVAAGDGFTFALTEDGAVWGWGCFKDDGSGAAGFPGAEGKLQRLPLKVYSPADTRSRVTKLAAGARHMAALTRRGDVLTWGMGGQGQLGRVEPFNNESFPPLEGLLRPAPAPGVAALVGGVVADVACGAYNTFAIGGRGAVAAWGLNNAGQLGLPVIVEDELQLDQQQGPEGAPPAEANGVGGGEQGQPPEQRRGDEQPQIGRGHFIWKPAAVDSLPSVAAVAGGEHHSLALTRAGAVLSFGAPTYGMLGRSNVDAAASKSDKQAPHPVDLSDGLADEAVAGIAAGTNVSAAVTRQGNLFLWGSNVNYQMAKGLDDDDNELPTRMRRNKAFGQRRVLAVAFGGQHGVMLASGEEQQQQQPAAGA